MTRLKILGKSWRLVRVPITRDKDDDAGLAFGKTNFQAGEIQISTVIRSPDQQLDTLIHEIVHVISTDLGLGLSESTVSALAAGLCGVILDNPRLFQAKAK